MMPVAEVEPAREYLVRISVGLLRSGDQWLPVRTQAEMLVVLRYLVEATDAHIKLSQTFVLERFVEKACVAERQVITLLFVRLQ